MSSFSFAEYRTWFLDEERTGAATRGGSASTLLRDRRLTFGFYSLLPSMQPRGNQDPLEIVRRRACMSNTGDECTKYSVPLYQHFLSRIHTRVDFTLTKVSIGHFIASIALSLKFTKNLLATVSLLSRNLYRFQINRQVYRQVKRQAEMTVVMTLAVLVRVCVHATQASTYKKPSHSFRVELPEASGRQTLWKKNGTGGSVKVKKVGRSK